MRLSPWTAKTVARALTGLPRCCHVCFVSMPTRRDSLPTPCEVPVTQQLAGSDIRQLESKACRSAHSVRLSVCQDRTKAARLSISNFSRRLKWYLHHTGGACCGA